MKIVSSTVLFTALVAFACCQAEPETSLETSAATSELIDPEFGVGVQGTLVNTSSSLLRLTSIPGVCDGTKQLVCASCTTLRLCQGTVPGQDLTVTCSTDQPYCNFGTTSDRCSADPIPDVCTDPNQNVPVTCSAVGKLPDASNCRIYHGCLTIGESSSIYTCPTGYVFHPGLELCALENLFARCTRIQCSGNFLGHVRYGNSLRFYGFCDGTGQAPIVFKCPNRANFAFIAGTTFGECVYACPAQGNFPNTNDPSTYFQCFWANRRLRYNVIRCPTGTRFNATLRICT
uniref:Chitin-binding type-2 domain-containing protein n=2 Tax=Anopheles albimanus TaxID=7167 RepID=A0A182F451_ANOAL